MKKRNWLFTITAIILLFIPPFTVNLLFKIKTNIWILQAEWSEDALLGYLGSLTGSFATLAAVLLTIHFTKEQQQNELAVLSKPWLTSSTKLLSDIKDVAKEENGLTWFVSYNENTFGVGHKVPYLLSKPTHIFNKNDCVIRYQLTNVGGNTATKLDIQLNGAPLFPIFALGVHTPLVLVFVLPLQHGELKTKYTLNFSYSDIMSYKKYSQQETLTIMRDEYGVTFAQEISETLSEPRD